MKTVFRLDKYLADMSVGTRSEVKSLIKKGRVSVNGEVIVKPEHKVDIEKDILTCDGKQINYISQVYYMLNKPAGVITATNDKRQKTVLDLITDKERKDLFPVGRLDKDTEGLLLITNDGMLAHELLSPKKHVSKRYHALIAGQVTEEDVKAFADGLPMDEEWTALPAQLEVLSVHSRQEIECESEADATITNQELVQGMKKETLNVAEQFEIINQAEEKLELTPEQMAYASEIEVVIYEGKFHQIKRMFEAVGKKVVTLKRLSMGELKLDPTLAPGEYKVLSEEELALLKK